MFTHGGHAYEEREPIMVQEYLSSIAKREGGVRKARQRLLELADESKMRFGKKTWRREELHRP